MALRQRPCPGSECDIVATLPRIILRGGIDGIRLLR